jgi:tetratricopeptide (TPR) repeat protein
MGERRLRAALADYEKALIVQPDDAYVYASRALTLSQKGRAIADVDKAISIEPKEPFFPKLKGDIHARHGDAQAAIASYDWAIELDPKSNGVYSDEADIYPKLGDTEREVAVLTRLIVVAPADQHGLFLRALAYEKLGKLDLAMKDSDALVVLNPSNQVYTERRDRLRKPKDGAGPLPVPPVVVDEAPPAKSVAQSPEAPAPKEAERTPSKLNCCVFVPGANLTISVPCTK